MEKQQSANESLSNQLKELRDELSKAKKKNEQLSQSDQEQKKELQDLQSKY